MRINPDRPMEELVGDNRGIVRMKLGNIHCMTPFREAARICRPENIGLASSGLKRGLLKCVWETLQEYRETYRAVTGGAR